MDNEMSDTQRQEWSRHYDDIQWKVIPIFTAGVGALVVYSFGASLPVSPWPEICGLALIFLGVLYVGSFRSFRNRLHDGIANAELKAFLKHPGPAGTPHQWDVFVLSFFAASCLFSYQLATKISYFWVTFGCLVLIAALLLYVLWKMGSSEISKEQGTSSGG